ncbi:MAG: hypothetical protein RMJ97_00485 [Raineya sp.]|nr:hypothetical protein [Raineya sp.]
MISLKFLTYFLSSFIVFLVGGGSCIKREHDIISSKMPGNTTIKGRLTTFAGSKGIANQTCYAYWQSDDGKVIRFKNSFHTDENGFYEASIYLRKSENNSGKILLTLANYGDYMWNFDISAPEYSYFFFSKKMQIGENVENPPFEIHTISFLEVGFSGLPPISSGEQYQVNINSVGNQLFSTSRIPSGGLSRLKIDVPAGMNLQAEIGIYKNANFIPYRVIQIAPLAPKEIRSI